MFTDRHVVKLRVGKAFVNIVNRSFDKHPPFCHFAFVVLAIRLVFQEDVQQFQANRFHNQRASGPFIQKTLVQQQKPLLQINPVRQLQMGDRDDQNPVSSPYRRPFSSSASSRLYTSASSALRRNKDQSEKYIKSMGRSRSI